MTFIVEGTAPSLKLTDMNVGLGVPITLDQGLTCLIKDMCLIQKAIFKAEPEIDPSTISWRVYETE